MVKLSGSWMAVLFLILCTWKVSSGLEEMMDIRFYDESYYLTQGYFHPLYSWVADYSPLYSLWYKFQGLFYSDAVSLYYGNYRSWTFGLGLMIILLLRLAGISWHYALLWGMLATASQLALPLWPKAGHLALLGTVAGIWGLMRWRNSLLSSLLWVSGTGLVLSYCRPEFLAAALVAALLIFPALLVERKVPQLLCFLPLLLGLCAVMVWGIPAGQSGRGMVAFGQHFVHNWRNISGNTQSDFTEDWVNWRPILAQHFGKASNLAEAFVNNPGAFLQHLWFNLRYLAYNSLVFFSETIFPKRIFGVSPLYGLAMLLFAGEWLSGFRAAEQLWNSLRKLSIQKILPWLILALPSVLAGLFFQPRPHYILPLLAFFVLLLGRYFSLIQLGIPEAYKRFSLLLLFPVLFFLLPECSAFFRIVPNGKNNTEKNYSGDENHFGPVSCASLNHKHLLADLEKFPFPQQFRIFDASTGASEYLGQKLVQCGKTGFEMNYAALADLEKFLDSAEVDGILIHKTIHYDHFFTRNPFWQKLRARPEELGWRKTGIGSAGDSLLFRKEIQF